MGKHLKLDNVFVKYRIKDGVILDVRTTWAADKYHVPFSELIAVAEVDPPEGVEIWEILALYRVEKGVLVLKNKERV